jgi:antitoxin (DNA-binding transcriptional repressor) of toxin-antitoxin stability system
MATVTICDLRKHGGEVVDRALRGERIMIIRAGNPVAELQALRSPLSVEVLLDHWRRLPAVEPTRMREDLDRVLVA